MFFNRPISASRSFSRRVIVWFTGATLILVFGAIAVFLSVRSLTEQNDSLARTLDTREVMSTLIADLHQTGAGQQP